MKKKLALIGMVVTMLTACDNSAENQSKKIATDLSDFVDSVEKLTPEYTNTFWANIETAYERKEAKAEAVRANMDESSQKKIEETKAEFIAFKERYKDQKGKYEQQLAEDKKNKIRAALFGEDKGSTLEYAWVNASNIAGVYKKFVDAVDANKKEYTESDWEFIKDAFKSLDNRRDEISKDISGKDKLKITEEKVRFGAIKAVN
jgi:exonuclease VII large subunit